MPNFCVTLFKDPNLTPNSTLTPNPNYLIIGKEVCPRTGRIHWHVYIEGLRNMNEVKGALHDNTCHVERRRGSQQQAIDYVKKGGDWFEIGEPVYKGKRTDLDKIKKLLDDGGSLLDAAEENFGSFVRYHKGFERYKDLLDAKRRKTAPLEMPQVIVHCGPAGSGKSWACANDPDYIKDGYKFPSQAPGKVYFDGYAGESVIWFDEFSGSTMPFSLFCQIADRYGCRVETKGGSVEIIGLKKILISSIEPPEVWWAKCERYLRDPNQLTRRITERVNH